MMNKKYIRAFFLIVALFVIFTSAFAREPVTLESLQSEIETQRAEIKALKAEIEMLKAQISELSAGSASDPLQLSEILLPTTASSAQKYVVQDGDTCWGIAVDKFKVPLDSFLAVNGIPSSYCNIVSGQEVIIPSGGNPIPTPIPYIAPASSIDAGPAVIAPVSAAAVPAPGAAASSIPAPVSDTAVSENCHPNYVGVCLPLDNDVRCKDIPYKRFQWVNSDPYKLDRDGDGICCES